MLINKIPPLVITKEHGSWAVLLVPIFVSAGVVGTFTINFILFAFSAIAFVLAYTPGHTLLRHHFGSHQDQEKVEQAKFWTVAYLVIGFTFALWLLITGYTFLIVFGGLAAISFLGNFFVTRRYSKSIVSDLLAAAGLTLGGPSAYYVLTGRVDSTALLLYIFNFLFFGCSIFYVHMKIRASGIKKPRMTWVDKVSFGKMNLAYHIVVVSLVGALVALHSASIIALLAFVPMFVHAVFGTLKLSGRVRFKNLGFLLLAQSIVFGVLLTLVKWK